MGGAFVSFAPLLIFRFPRKVHTCHISSSSLLSFDASFGISRLHHLGHFHPRFWTVFFLDWMYFNSTSSSYGNLYCFPPSGPISVVCGKPYKYLNQPRLGVPWLAVGMSIHYRDYIVFWFKHGTGGHTLVQFLTLLTNSLLPFSTSKPGSGENLGHIYHTWHRQHLYVA